MITDSLITILPFPQRYDGTNLHLNFVVIPRNIDPLADLVPGASPFADANLNFEARIISGLGTFPMDSAVTNTVNLDDVSGITTDARPIFEAFAAQYNIVPKPVNLPAQKSNVHYIRKYLPRSYRKAFNFHSPRTDRAVLDDAYQCAVRDVKKGKNPAFQQSPDTMSWGKVIAYCLRQPALARQMGLIQETTIPVDPTWFEDGGFIYIGLRDGDYFQEQQDSLSDISSGGAELVKKYAARIPELTDGENRLLFAPVLFPVLFDDPGVAGPPEPNGNYDQVFIEASQYDDGFSKIVHANQPVSADLLEEEENDNPPAHEMGIRLGWEDEQILIWQNRQMEENPDDPGSKKALDAPLGVFAYRIDVREEGEADWNSLVRVQSRQPVNIGAVNLGIIEAELGVEVYPMQLDGYTDENHFWLPQYLASWNGKSLVLPDEDAAFLYRLEESMTADSQGLGNNRQAQLNRLYEAVGLDDVSLVYGSNYEFQVRMTDLSGGGPEATSAPVHEGEAPIATAPFRRYVVPREVELVNKPKNDDFFVGEELVISRPRLGYPAVVFTGKYPADQVIDLLRTDSELATDDRPFGLPDPDVTRVEIVVEIQSLKMDSADSVSRRENYIHYYTTYRDFPVNFQDNEALVVPIDYLDAKVLDFSNPIDPTKDIMGTTLGDLTDNQTNLLLPRNRQIRLTVRPLGNGDPGYFGTPTSHVGKPIQFFLRAEALDETDLFVDTAPSQMIRGIYLQPDAPAIYDGDYINALVSNKKQPRRPSDLLDRLCLELDLKRKGLSIFGEKGQRLQFGCSRKIRHTLSPDHSALTLASKNDLLNHWIVPIQLDLDRDWTWDGMPTEALKIERRIINGTDDSWQEVGEIEIMRTASMESLDDPQRDQTKLYFLDAVTPQVNAQGFPHELELEYVITPNFKQEDVAADDPLRLEILLPVTTFPAQIPKLVSAGIALSKYNREQDYSASEPRQKYLWVELEEPVADPNDALFCRLLGYGPDPLLTKFEAQMLLAPEEPELPIDDELIRVISPGQSNDFRSLTAMQEMRKAQAAEGQDPAAVRHYILPLPPGMHSSSDELFGFFKYEFRVGHRYNWSTAQGRFGRAFETNGVQHPAPTLFCNVNRDPHKVYVNAPYAVSVYKGRNVTADPPRTELWCMLYAQVKQADGKDYRNILIDEIMLCLQEREGLQIGALEFSSSNQDATPIAFGGWKNQVIHQRLKSYGLPLDAPLSVLCVEMIPRLSSYVRKQYGVKSYAMMSRSGAADMAAATPVMEKKPDFSSILRAVEEQEEQRLDCKTDGIRPLSDQLGQHRILRTSPLTKVPDICCTDC
jgi:hypothetical protein